MAALSKILKTEVFGPELSSAIESDGESGKIIRAMEKDVVERLAKLNSKEQKSLGKHWRAKAEGLESWSVNEVNQMVEKLCVFALKAHEGNFAILYSVVW